MAAITTLGVLYIYFDQMTSNVPKEVVEFLKTELESVEGVSFPADVSRKSPRVPEVTLRDPVKLRAVLKAIKRAVDTIHGLNDN